MANRQQKTKNKHESECALHNCDIVPQLYDVEHVEWMSPKALKGRLIDIYISLDSILSRL